MKIKQIFIRVLCIFLVGTAPTLEALRKPRLVVVFVVDQLNKKNLDLLYPHLQGGIKLLYNGGIVYHNAHMPHGMPATASGHASLSTGTLPRDHGLIRNQWYNRFGRLICSDQDTPAQAAVFAPNGFYYYGKSAANLAVDTLSDQALLHGANHQVFALSLKSRAATALAGKLGKAIWFDNKSGNFTSSTAYFGELPQWLQEFNIEHRASKKPWRLLHPRRWSGYHLADAHTYDHTALKSLIRNPKLITKKYPQSPYGLFAKTPHANQLLCDLAKKCLDRNFTNSKCDTFILWLSLSSPDNVGHVYGPDSLEYLDMMYQVDCQMYDFIRYAKQLTPLRDILFVLTSDHGIEPIPELMQERGYENACRIDQRVLIQKMNRATRKYLSPRDQMQVLGGTDQLVTHFKAPQFYFNHEVFDRLSLKRKELVIKELKEVLLDESGIKHVWTPEELQDLDVQPHELAYYFKNQLYPGRSGQLIVQTDPYCAITKYKTGANHKTPYDYNTHIPLILYQKHSLDDQHIHEWVSIDQVANTLAYLIGIPKPTASTAEVLPGIMAGPCCPF